MITSDDILKYIKMEPAEAYKLASEINLLAGKYNIDAQQIMELLGKNPEQLEVQIGQVQTQRQQLKINLKNMILPEQ